MNSRVLPPEEWHRLKGTEAEGAAPYFNSENTRVLVVEEAGEIVATWTVMRVVHAECIWVRPSHRGSFAVARRLIKGMGAIATAWGAKTVLTGSKSPFVTDLIRRFGGSPMPCETFILPVAAREAPDDRELGHRFHEQLAALLPEPQHADDPAHDEAVGRALRRAVEWHEPETAAVEYNDWARASGYESVRFLGSPDGRLRANIGTAIVELDGAYNVFVIQPEEALCQQAL